MNMRFWLLLFISTSLAMQAVEITFPSASGVRNVREFGALGDGTTDDTTAINRALEAAGLLYFPAGTYLVSDQLRPPERKGGAVSRRILQGADRDTVVIRLRDHCDGFGDATKPREVLRISWGVAQAFRNSIRDLTIDVGAGNPGASGCGYFASNQGHLRSVTLRAGPGSGAVGLNLDLGDNGPLTISDVRISGFGIGISTKYGSCFTLEDIALGGIRALGIRSQHSTLFLRKLHYRGDGPFLRDASNSATVLLDGDLATSAKGIPGIQQSGRILLRDVHQTGFTALVAGKEGALDVAQVDEWHSLPSPAAFTGSTRSSLDLPVAETPLIPWDPPEQWASVVDYPPTTVDGKTDWGPAVQAAIDSGKSTVYFPLGKGPYPIRSDVVLRGAVRRMTGLEQSISKVGDQDCRPLFTVADGTADGTADAVIIEQFDAMYSGISVRHQGKRRLILSGMQFATVEKVVGSGDLFLYDTYVQTLRLAGGRCWSRGLNSEYSQAHSPDGIHVINDGGLFWMFGFKNEGDGTKVATIGGGKSELYAMVLSNKATPRRSETSPVHDPRCASHGVLVGRRLAQAALGQSRR